METMERTIRYIINDSSDCGFGPVKQEDQYVGNNNIDPAMILSGSRGNNSSIGVKYQ